MVAAVMSPLAGFLKEEFLLDMIVLVYKCHVVMALRLQKVCIVFLKKKFLQLSVEIPNSQHSDGRKSHLKY